jgi:cation:H+ antiporter
MVLLQFVAGLSLLVAGAELLVRGASRLATGLGVSPVVVGLTVVAFGTSAPELAVSVSSALGGKDDIAFANVVGSNSFNILFILGLSALLTPLVVAQRLIRLDVPLMIVVSLGMSLLALDGRIDRAEGVVMLAVLLAWVALTVRLARKTRQEVVAEYGREYGGPSGLTPRGCARLAALVVGGLAGLVWGADVLVDAAVAIGRSVGMSERVIGVTVVSAGTSLPEVATSVVAALRGERDIAVGNVVGSNIFNVLCVLGLAAAVAPGGVGVNPAAPRLDLPVMVLASCACLPVFLTGHRISRWEGLVLLAGYVAYLAALVQRVGA